MTPGTYVQLGPPPHKEIGETFRPGFTPTAGEMAPEVALVLAAVLVAAAEQVNAEKLAAFSVSTRSDLTLLQLSMAFREDDTGLVGDVFEWSLLLALNNGDPVISQLMSDALLLSGVKVDQPQAVLVAAEPGRLVAFSPELPPGAALSTGRRGRPPHIANLVKAATTGTWKADLILGGSDERWVAASLKSNPKDLQRSMREAQATTSHPPRIGITASRQAGCRRDPSTGTVLVHVPVHGFVMALSKLVLGDVVQAFATDLSVPQSPLRQDVTGIGQQLYRWRHQTVDYAATALINHVREGSRSMSDPLFRWTPTPTGASVHDAHGSMVAVNPLRGEHPAPLRSDIDFDAVRAMKYVRFDPID